jgi:outer membrane protein TolC
MIKTSKYNILTSLFLVLFAGCSSFNDKAIREKQTTDYQRNLTEETNNVLSKKESFDLNDCIQIAIENNLRTRAAKIQQQIAKLERKIAFANFLPAVNLDYTSTTWDRQPKIKFGATAVPLHDRSIREITWQFQISVFDPSTWFLYAMRQRGEELAQFVTKYTQQMTILEVTINYYLCLSLQEAQSALQSQLNAANELEKEFGELYREGSITEWQYQQVQVTALARKTELTRTQSSLKQTTGDLLVSMGLSPAAEISLNTQQPLTEPNGSLEDLVYKALIENPQLHIADREVAIEEEKVKVALAAFLPRLTLFANRTNTSDSFQLFPDFWTYGLAGTLAVFNGFANIDEYKAAKERRKEAFIEREQLTLTLMLEVLKAYQNLQNAKDLAVLAQKSVDASSMHFEEVNEKWKQGIVPGSEMLAVLAEKNTAQTELMSSNFFLQVSIATLQNVMGTTYIPQVPSKNKNGK